VVKLAHSSSPATQLLPFVDVADQKQISHQQMGMLVDALATFRKRGLPTPPAWVLPLEAVTKIAHDNHLFQMLELEFSVLDVKDAKQVRRFSQDIIQHIQSMVLPKPIAKGFQKLYDLWLEHQFIAVRPSLIATKHQTEQLSELHIKGEANIIESLLNVWAKLYSPEHLPDRLQEWKKGVKIPAAFIFQVMVNAESSGVGIYTAATSKRAEEITIFSQWGVSPDAQTLFRQGDWFEVDPKTWHIKQRHVGVKRQEWVRRLDHLHQQPVQKRLQSHPSLTPQGAVALAKMVAAAHKGQFGSYIVDWAAGVDAAYILDIRPFEQKAADTNSLYFLPTAEQLKTLTPTHNTGRSYSGPTATKVYVAIGKSDQVSSQLAGADGIGLLRSEWAYLQLPDHPYYLLKTGKAEIVRSRLTELILNVAQTHQEDFPILFRSQNFTTNELVTLRHGKEYEPVETNPYLGYRGAVRIIHDYTLFDIELDSLQDAHLEGVRNIGLLLPFVRNHSELAIIVHHFTKPEYATQRFLRLWMQANTPENLLELEQYCMPGLEGISLNIQSIHALFHGIDPDNTDVFQLYPVHHQMFRRYLQTAREVTNRHHIQLVLQLEQYDQKLIEFASELGYDGVTVRAKDVHRTRQTIVNTEHQKMLK
jgi:phosphoenolpyruvate synthase/pyruvate phosphate dikinase